MDDKVRVFEVAEEAGSTSADVIKKAADLGIVLKSPQSTVTFEQAEQIAEYIMTGESKLIQPKQEEQKSQKKTAVTKTTKKETTQNDNIASEAKVKSVTKKKKK